MILNTQDISSELNKIIEKSSKILTLVSPYLQINILLKEAIQRKQKKVPDCKIVIITKEWNDYNQELEWLRRLPNLELRLKPNLHAKCYLNEVHAIITSMNLYEYSEKNNFELGVLITKVGHPKEFEEIKDQIENLLLSSELFFSSGKKHESKHGILEETWQNYVEQVLQNSFRSKDFQLNKCLQSMEIIEIASSLFQGKSDLKRIVLKYSLDEYSNILKRAYNFLNKLEIGKVVEVNIKRNDKEYDSVKFHNLKTNTISWYVTKQFLPPINELMVVRLNEEWFNEYEMI